MSILRNINVDECPFCELWVRELACNLKFGGEWSSLYNLEAVIQDCDPSGMQH